MSGIRLSASAVVPVPPGPPFSLMEGATGGGADQTNVWIVDGAGNPVRLTPYTDPTCTSPPCGDEQHTPRLNPARTLVATFDFDPDDFSTSLYVLPVDGSATYPLASGFRYFDDAGAGYWGNHPSWSPDGSKIVFSYSGPDGGSYLGGTLGGRIMQTTYPGGSVTNLWTPDVQSPTQREEGHSPQFSPDGSKIAFLVNIAAGGGGTASRQGLWVMDADGSNLTQLDGWATTVGDHGYLFSGTQLAWSNDSAWIVYVDRGFGGGTSAEGTFGVWKIQPDGTNKTLLVSGDGGGGTFIPHHIGWGAWLDDDSKVIYTENVGGWAIKSVNADGTGATELVAAGSGPAGGQNFETCYRLGARIYWVRTKSPALIQSCALDGTDVQTYYDGTPLGSASVASGTGFEWI